MDTSCTIQEGHAWFSVNGQSIEVSPKVLSPVSAD
jgi:hypothetical protein